MIERNSFNNYINNFRRNFVPYLKSGVGMQTRCIPYESGAVIVIEVGQGLLAKDEYRTSASSLQEALQRTNLFELITTPVTVPGTSIVMANNKLVLIKTEDTSEWSEGASVKDVNGIINKVFGK